MVQLTDDFLQSKWNPYNVASPINAKDVLRERLLALTFGERKAIVVQREVLDWKMKWTKKMHVSSSIIDT
ncbi:MAG: hypothetical protein SGPRY_012894 [Prymnesium sp.]